MQQRIDSVYAKWKGNGNCLCISSVVVCVQSSVGVFGKGPWSSGLGRWHVLAWPKFGHK